MKTTVMILGALALIAAASRPAAAGLSYYDGTQANARSSGFGAPTMSGNIPSNVRGSDAPIIIGTVPDRVIEFTCDKDGRWWPSRSSSR